MMSSWHVCYMPLYTVYSPMCNSFLCKVTAFSVLFFCLIEYHVDIKYIAVSIRIADDKEIE